MKQCLSRQQYGLGLVHNQTRSWGRPPGEPPGFWAAARTAAPPSSGDSSASRIPQAWSGLPVPAGGGSGGVGGATSPGSIQRARTQPGSDNHPEELGLVRFGGAGEPEEGGEERGGGRALRGAADWVERAGRHHVPARSACSARLAANQRRALFPLLLSLRQPQGEEREAGSAPARAEQPQPRPASRFSPPPAPPNHPPTPSERPPPLPPPSRRRCRSPSSCPPGSLGSPPSRGAAASQRSRPLRGCDTAQVIESPAPGPPTLGPPALGAPFDTPPPTPGLTDFPNRRGPGNGGRAGRAEGGGRDRRARGGREGGLPALGRGPGLSSWGLARGG
ncbi:basic salivary proline-rich protein 4-like [Dromiciops gliroides]|uniref:basic salivary proline-rich protein 4-like n=1 Tax=Dromiciops gliroides TaxID=33562 RepID=UPI001CC773B7|nr:basic salivary proline-rich protein 4-like [Dromiciops gliroides]